MTDFWNKLSSAVNKALPEKYQPQEWFYKNIAAPAKQTTLDLQTIKNTDYATKMAKETAQRNIRDEARRGMGESARYMMAPPPAPTSGYIGQGMQGLIDWLTGAMNNAYQANASNTQLIWNRDEATPTPTPTSFAPAVLGTQAPTPTGTEDQYGVPRLPVTGQEIVPEAPTGINWGDHENPHLQQSDPKVLDIVTNAVRKYGLNLPITLSHIAGENSAFIPDRHSSVGSDVGLVQINMDVYGDNAVAQGRIDTNHPFYISRADAMNPQKAMDWYGRKMRAELDKRGGQYFGNDGALQQYNPMFKPGISDPQGNPYTSWYWETVRDRTNQYNWPNN